MKHLIAFEIYKFFKKRKNIITIGFFCVCLLCYVYANTSLNSIKEKSKVDSYKNELSTIQDSISKMENDKNKPEKEIEIINKFKNTEKLLTERLNAKLRNDWKTEILMQIQIDQQLISDINNNKVVSGENPDNIKSRIEINQILYKNNIKPIIEENSMTGYNFIKLAFQQILPFLSIALLLLLSADCVSSENDEGTFKFLLMQPVSRLKVIFSKIISYSLACIFVEFVIIFTFFIILGLKNGFGSPLYPVKYYTGNLSSFFNNAKGSFNITYISINKIIQMSIPLIIIFTFFIIALGILVSVIMQNSMTSISISIIIAIAINIFNSQLKLFKKASHIIPFTYNNSIEILNGNMIGQFNNLNITYVNGLIIMITFTSVMYLISCLIFNKKDINC